MSEENHCDICHRLEMGDSSPECISEAVGLIKKHRQMIAGMRRGVLDAWYDLDLVDSRRDVLSNRDGMEPHSRDEDAALLSVLIGFERQVLNVRDALGLKPKESLSAALEKLKAERIHAHLGKK